MFIFLSLGALIGATILNFFATLPSVQWIGIVSSSGLLSVLLILRYCTPKIYYQCSIIALGFLVGLIWAYVEAQNRLSWTLPEKDIQSKVEITARVVGITQIFDKTLRFDVQLLHYNTHTVHSIPKLRLYWQNPSYRLLDGDVIRCHVQLKPAWRFANPGSFDQEKQLFIEGIRATGRVMALLEYSENKTRSLAQLRQYLYERMGVLLQGKPLLGVIQATTLGLYKNITPEQWQVFQATGTTHAVAISGLHVSLVAMLCSGLTVALVRRSMQLTSRYPAQFYGAIAALIGAFLYCTLAGFSIPTQRSLAMIIVMMIAILKRRPLLSWHSLALAWWGVMIVDPLSTLQIGFWLSFGCVAALIYGHSHQGSSRFHKWIVPQIVVFIGLMPLSLLFFQQIALLSPVANFITLPIINFVVIPASLLGLLFIPVSTPLATLCLWVAHTSLESIWKILELISHIPVGIWQQGAPSFWNLSLAMSGAIILLAPRGLPVRHLGWMGFLPMLFSQPVPLKPGECRFALLDVGQGLAAVIQTEHHTLLYDAGPQYTDTADAGKRIIIPFLLSQNIKSIDQVIISHGDLDHRGGMKSLTPWIKGSIMSGEPERLNRPSIQCDVSQHWEWDGVQFALLSPLTDLDQKRSKKRNDHSCVLKVTTPKHSILLTGDIEHTAEKKLSMRLGSALKSTILVVPHHGSLTSSSFEFISYVSPQYALYPVGLGNRYGFPKREILKRYEQIGSKNLISYQTGALIFHLNSVDELTPPTCWRETSRHYWHRV